MANNIKSQLFSGVFYTALAKYSGVVISLVVAGILARLLSPDDFGIVAVATVIIAFFNLLTDMGVSPAIVQHKSLTKDDLSDIFSFTIWTGIGISILFFASSWIIADYYQSDTLRILCQLLSVNLFFASATIVPGAMFYRNKEFKFIAIRSFVIQISAGAAAVTAALCGAGLYALIINPIVSSVLIFVISFQRYPQRLRFTLGLRVLRKIFSYSAYQFLFNVINYFSRNLDKLLIGKYMSMSDLGYYEKSYRLMMLPLQNITVVQQNQIVFIRLALFLHKSIYTRQTPGGILLQNKIMGIVVPMYVTGLYYLQLNDLLLCRNRSEQQEKPYKATNSSLHTLIFFFY